MSLDSERWPLEVADLRMRDWISETTPGLGTATFNDGRYYDFIQYRDGSIKFSTERSYGEGHHYFKSPKRAAEVRKAIDAKNSRSIAPSAEENAA
jgi:hypothetical protein